MLIKQLTNVARIKKIKVGEKKVRNLQQMFLAILEL